ncbi:hypothetical protein [Aureispira anguillae]|uniref:Uncharacterized protein n=1 Tax=Aureispira anguillae TaxID=2864201 RepID=A0A916DV38_9BACT|nr:hypothetical protein [Aureispira anguillae]BDS12761.1 hypothetical protein AsAng_0034860 [Aureispira anguillae]
MSKRKTKKINYNSIALLNCPENDGGAYIRIRMYGDVNKKGSSYDCQITISDCNNRALLHGEFGSPEGKYNTLYKINTLIDELEKAKKELEAITEEHHLKIKAPE